MMDRDKPLVSKEWIGIDLDGTLAHYEGWGTETHIGDPIEPMLLFVKALILQGHNVKIFTARVAPEFMYPGDIEAKKHSDRQRTTIQDWLAANGLPKLEITCIKDYHMISLYDDRAFRVVFNKGLINTTDAAYFESFINTIKV